MAKTVSLSIPHDLTQDEARQRIQTGLTDLRSRFGEKATSVHEQWTENRLDFAVTAMNQSITGRVDVTASDVRIEVDLPWMLAMLAGKFKGRVEQEARKMLEDKRAH